MDNKKTAIVIGAIAVVFIAFLMWAIPTRNATQIRYDQYDINALIGPNEDNGQIGDHVKGNEDAPVLLFEYADFQCSGCASVNPFVKKLVDKYEGKLGVVFRYYILSYHQNGKAAASAAEAAGLQGHWEEYGDLLFKNQNEWFSSNVNERTELYKKYFEVVTEGKGDMEQFENDLASKRVEQRVNFDTGIAEDVLDVQATPAFYLDGEFLDWSGAKANTEEKFIKFFSEKIEAKLKES